MRWLSEFRLCHFSSKYIFATDEIPVIWQTPGKIGFGLEIFILVHLNVYEVIVRTQVLVYYSSQLTALNNLANYVAPLSVFFIYSSQFFPYHNNRIIRPRVPR